MAAPYLTAQELAEVRAYKDPIYVGQSIHYALGLVVWLLCLRFVVARLYAWSQRVTAWLHQRFKGLRSVPVLRAFPAALDRVWGGPGWGAAVLFMIVLLDLNTFVFLPIDYYFDYVHEHRFGLMTESQGSYWADYVKGVLLSWLPMTALSFGMFGLARRLPRWWLVIGGVGAAGLLFSAALDPYRSQVYLDREPLAAGEVRDAITGLMAKAQVDFQDVIIEKSLSKGVRLQAYFAGKGPTRMIVLNDSLLKNLSTDEVLAAVGHEAGHVSELRWPGHIASTVGLLGFLYVIELLMRLVPRRGWWGVTERADVRTLPLILVVFWVAIAITSPVSAAFGRERERKADLYGVSLTRNPDAFRRMLIKAARVNKMDPDPPRLIVLNGWSHPPIPERLDAIDAWEKTNGGQ